MGSSQTDDGEAAVAAGTDKAVVHVTGRNQEADPGARRTGAEHILAQCAPSTCSSGGLGVGGGAQGAEDAGP